MCRNFLLRLVVCRDGRRAVIRLSIVCVVLGVALAAQAPKASLESSAFLARVAGVYREQFQNAFVNGEKYQSEDVLEVVPVDDHAAYVRMDLQFSNGHSGRIFGVAVYGRNSLIYDNGKSGDERCVVDYVWSKDMMVTKADYEKTPGCRFYHGARGTLDGLKFSLSRRRAIRYMQRLKDSQEFKAAMDQYRKSAGYLRLNGLLPPSAPPRK